MWLMLIPEAHRGGDEGGVELSSIPFAYVQLAIVIVVAVVELAWLMRDMTRRVNAYQFAEQIRKLLAANNPERALKLCNAASGPVTRLARMGIEARMKGGDLYVTLAGATPVLLKEARAGFPAIIALGALASFEGLVLLVRGFEQGTHGDFVWKVLFPLGFLCFATTLNVQRWLGWERDLTTVRDRMSTS